MASPGFRAIDTSIANPAAMAMGAADAAANQILGGLWLGVFYVCGMIWTILALIDRWRGPHHDGNINVLKVVAAFLLAVVWPFVLLCMAM